MERAEKSSFLTDKKMKACKVCLIQAVGKDDD